MHGKSTYFKNTTQYSSNNIYFCIFAPKHIDKYVIPDDFIIINIPFVIINN